MRAAVACPAAATVASPKGPAVAGTPGAVLTRARLRRATGRTRTTAGTAARLGVHRRTAARRTAVVTGRPVPWAPAARSGHGGAVAETRGPGAARAPASQPAAAG